MKKLLLVLAAAFAMVACQTDINEVGVVGGEVDVTFEVGTPTRAYSDGKTATRLQYAIYDETGAELTALTKTDATIDITATVSFKLVTGNKYTAIFWADNDNAPYTVDFEHKTMTIDYTGVKSNDEELDAFYAIHEFTVKGAQTEIIELRRPFAQLNIGTNDYTASIHAGYTPVKSHVKVTNIYNTLNLWTGAVDNETAVEFACADIKKDEKFPVAGYEYLAMNYLLVAADKETVDVEFAYTESDDTAAKTRIVGSVPVQRNYRTNIYGQLLTSDVDINVEIKPEYKEPAYEADALYHAAAFGGEVTLTEDVVLETPLNVQTNMVINLNGKAITGNWHKNDGAVIKNNATLTIVGGTISSLANNGGSAIQNNGTMVVTDATLNGAPNADGSWPSYTVNNTGNLTLNNVVITSHHGAVASYGDDAVVTLNDSTIDMQGIPGFTSHGIYTYNNGEVVVNGGTYTNHATDQAASGASVINGAVTVNNGDFSGRIENYYGTPVLKGGSYTVNPTRFVAAGLKALQKDGKYYVVAEDVDTVATTATEVMDALKVADQTISLAPAANGTHLMEGKMSLASGVSLIGLGSEPVAVLNDWGSNAFANQAHFTNTTVENINFTNNLVIDAGIANGDVLFKDCVFGGDRAHQGVHFDSGNATIVFDGCTFVGRNMFGASLTKVVFNNCTFLNKKSSLTGADKWTGVNMWGKYEFNNCVFDTEATCNVKCDGVEAVFTNCKYVDNRDITTIIKNSPNYTCEISFK